MMGKLMTWKRSACVGCFVVSAISLTAPALAQEAVHDPLEGFNRAMFSVNEALPAVVCIGLDCYLRLLSLLLPINTKKNTMSSSAMASASEARR